MTASALDAVDALLEAVRHRRLRGLGTEPVDEPLQAIHLGLLADGHLGQSLFVLASGREVLRVGPLVLDERPDVVVAATVEVQDARDRGVEQVEVVADDDERAAVLGKESEQPVAGVVVEVVRRLVEQEQLAAGEQDASELDAAALAARQDTDRQVEPIAPRPSPAARLRTSDSAA